MLDVARVFFFLHIVSIIRHFKYRKTILGSESRAKRCVEDDTIIEGVHPCFPTEKELWQNYLTGDITTKVDNILLNRKSCGFVENVKIGNENYRLFFNLWKLNNSFLDKRITYASSATICR